MAEYIPNIAISGTPYVYDKGIIPLIQKIDERVRFLRSQGRLTPEVLQRIQKYFRIKNIHHSNAIEGNRLDYGETRMVVEQGLTITGKPLRDSLEAKNLAQAMDFFEELVSHTDKPITLHDVRQIHAAILAGIDDSNAGKYRLSEVEISGSQYKPPSYIHVPDEMEKFGIWLETITSADYVFQTSPVILACAAHTWFVYIHPFLDGNGRTARILMNLVLMRHGYPISIVTRDDRARYYDSLEASHGSDLTPFISLICDTLEESLDEYERAVREQVDNLEWARSLMQQVKVQQEKALRVQYDVWKSAMELLKSYFKQTVDTLNEISDVVTVYFTGYDVIDFEKYINAQRGIIIKRSWFFRLDIVSGPQRQYHSRYMFFFGLPSNLMKTQLESPVSIFISREERPFYYERLDQIYNSHVPSLREISYSAQEETFLCRYDHDNLVSKKVEVFGREFIEDTIRIHIHSQAG